MATFDLKTCGESISDIGGKITEYKLWNIDSYRFYYPRLIKVYNHYIKLSNNSSCPTKEIIRCEMMAWELYTNFMRNKLRNSFRAIILKAKDWRQNSPYKLCIRKINGIVQELKENHLDEKTKLLKLRELGKLYLDIENQEIMTFGQALVVVGIILSILAFFRS